MSAWNVYEAQYEGGRFGGKRLPDKLVAEGVSQAAADSLIRKSAGSRWAQPVKKQ